MLELVEACEQDVPDLLPGLVPPAALAAEDVGRAGIDLDDDVLVNLENKEKKSNSLRT